MDRISVTLKLERETKGTYRYETQALDAAISTVYIKKGAIGSHAPEKITITIAEA